MVNKSEYFFLHRHSVSSHSTPLALVVVKFIILHSLYSTQLIHTIYIMYQLWKWKAFVHVIIITTTATIMHHHPQLLLMQMVYTRRQQNNLSTKTTPPPHHHHHFTCQLHYHVKPFPIHRHCTILQLYLWIMVMLMVLIYYYPPPHLNDVSLGYSHPQ